MQFKCNVYFLCEVIWILCFVERECCRYGPGRNCGFPCKCTGDNVCDSDTGACLGGSQCQTVPPSGYGWGGPGCRIGNVAYAKTNLAQSGGYLYYTAELAVDGDITPYISNANNESCARPFNHSEPYAWWWVDLGDIFNIQSVTLVNRQTKYGTIPKSRYLDRSTNYDIKIGNTSDRTQQTLCFHQDKPAEEIQPIETMACDNGVMAGQYVSFTRTGGVDPDQAALCEFIVMGYKPIECHPDDCTDDCNSTIGCEKCVAGKMLPDCTQECPDGYWGVNCADTCGMCTDGVVCDKMSGSCGDQCVSWYLPQLCTELLKFPPVPLSVSVSDITFDSAILSWERSTGFDADILKYFYYTVEYRRKYDNTDDWHTSNIIALSNETSFRYDYGLTHLEHNTEFVVNIVPYREINGLTETGTIKAKEFKTLCTAPAIPPTPSIHGTQSRFTVTWEPITSLSSGCDRLRSAVLIMTCENSTHTLLNEIYDILNANRTLTYETPNVLSCSVVLFVTNNADLSSASAITSVLTVTTPTTETITSVLPSTTQVTVTDSLTKVTSAGQRQPIDGGPNITPIAIGAVAGVVIIILVVVIVVLVLRNRRNTPSHSGSKPDTCTPGFEKPNPVYENTTSGDNDNIQTTRGAFKQGEKSMTPNVVKGSESQYASLDETHQTTAKLSPVYQELK